MKRWFAMNIGSCASFHVLEGLIMIGFIYYIAREAGYRRVVVDMHGFPAGRSILKPVKIHRHVKNWLSKCHYMTASICANKSICGDLTAPRNVTMAINSGIQLITWKRFMLLINSGRHLDLFHFFLIIFKIKHVVRSWFLSHQ